MLPFTSKPLWPQEIKKLNLVEIDSCPIIICLVSMWPGHRAVLLEEGKGGVGGCFYKSCEQIGAAINKESCSQFIYYSFCDFRIQILWPGWKMN